MEDAFIQNGVTFASRHQLKLAGRLGFGIHGILHVAENKSAGGRTAVNVYEKWNPVRESHPPVWFCGPPPGLLGQRDKKLALGAGSVGGWISTRPLTPVD
jgi:hypothetical protein